MSNVADIGTDANGFEVTIAALPQSVGLIRNEIARLAAALGDGPRVQDIKLAVTEACANAVTHAYARGGEPGRLEVSARGEDRVLTVEVRDHGGGIVPWDETRGLRLGMPLITRLAETVEVQSDPGSGTTIRMTFHLDRAAVVGA